MLHHCGERKRVLHTRFDAESTEEREARLQQLRSAQEQRITAELMEEREAHLQQLRSAQKRRIAAESTEERETRLQQLRESMKEREALIHSTLWMLGSKQLHLRQTEARRDRDRQYHTPLQAVEPLQLQQPHILHKIKQFHSKLTNLQVG